MNKITDIEPAWLAPTWFVDSDSDAVGAWAEQAVGAATDPIEVARRLFLAVRDGIRYDPYAATEQPAHYRASFITTTERNWCIPKSVLLTACARRMGIPARLGFADVRNHLTSEKLGASMGTDLFAWHGYSVLLLDGRWVKLSTAFNIELCERFGTKVLEFDGVNDSLMHPYDEAGRRHMEYVNDRGIHDDLPLNDIFETFLQIYPGWVKHEDGSFGRSTADARIGSASAAGDSKFA